MPPRRHASAPLRLPFQVGKDGLQALDGTPLPVLREGVLGEILITTADLVDEELAERLATLTRHEILPSGTDLWVGVQAVKRDGFLQSSEEQPQVPWLGDVAPVRLEAPLELEVNGALTSKLRQCPCSSPAFDGKRAVSLNHAFTVLSERYETNRLSHTGSVFERVFYFDSSAGRWRGLGELRDQVVHRVAVRSAAMADEDSA